MLISGMNIPLKGTTMGRPAGALPSPAAPHQPPFVTLGELVAGVADGSRVSVGGALLEPAVADDLGVTEEPSAEMLRVLREEIDPLGIRRLEFAPARERAGRLAACIAAEQDLIDWARA
jgi:hypothetical protein